MNNPDPELSGWAMSLEKDFLLECPKCHYVFGDTLSLTNDRVYGTVTCRRCGQAVDWREKVTRTFICEEHQPNPNDA